ncbi:MAG: cupin [Gemmataceae bacterium]|nr:cupin [Gemmataceae bacterium]
MGQFIEKPAKIRSAGNLPKIIEEYFGRVNSNDSRVSIARMSSPAGWREPGQTPDFDEYSVVLRGQLRVETCKGVVQVGTGQGFLAPAGQWVRYSTPGADGAEYIAVCIAAFSPETVNRDCDPV